MCSAIRSSWGIAFKWPHHPILCHGVPQFNYLLGKETFSFAHACLDLSILCHSVLHCHIQLMALTSAHSLGSPSACFPFTLIFPGGDWGMPRQRQKSIITLGVSRVCISRCPGSLPVHPPDCGPRGCPGPPQKPTRGLEDSRTNISS